MSGSKTLFKKQLIRFGEWIDPIFPDEVMRIDRVLLEQILKNWKAGIPGRVPVPLTHTDDPTANAGEVVDLMIEGDGTSVEDGLYGILDIRREEIAEDIRKELIFDVSISFTYNFVDNETGAQHGPTLVHVALVNNPYIKKMGAFAALSEEIKAGLSEQFGGLQVRMLSENAHKENKAMNMTQVSNDREFPVEVVYTLDDTETTLTIEPGAAVEVPAAAAEAVRSQIREATAPQSPAPGKAADAQQDDEADTTDLSETQQLQRQLAETQRKLRAKEIDEQYERSLAAGKLVPAQKEAFYALADALHASSETRQLSENRTLNLSELLAEFVDKAPQRVSLNEETGKHTDDSDRGPLAQLSEESKQGLSKMGVSEEDYVKYGARESISINELVNKESN